MSFEIRYVDRTYEVQRYYNVHCDNCNSELQPNCPVDAEGGWEWLSAKNALKLRLISNYGSFFDSALNRDPVALLCQSCARKFLEAFPGIGEVIRNVDAGPDEPLSGPFSLGVRAHPGQQEDLNFNDDEPRTS